MDQKQSEDLFKRYSKGEAIPKEAASIESWFNHFTDRLPSKGMIPDDPAREERIWSKLGIVHKPRQVYPFMRYVAAAAMIVVVGIVWLYFSHPNNSHQETIARTLKDIKPGKSKAILTLADGTEVSLSTSSVMVAAKHAPGLLISNDTASGTVTINMKSDRTGGKNSVQAGHSSNTITTPRGGQYRLILPDGTLAVLNAESKITFPSGFVGKNRIVSTTGEVYFEVAKDPDHPFQVNTEEQQLTVLGTHFNVAAYPNETVKTTLLEGSVLLLQPSTGISRKLKPLQRATLLSKNGFDVKTVTPSLELGWIDGRFIFKETPLSEVMRVISRWYDVDVDYSSLPNQNVTGNFTRDLSLVDVLTAIDYYSKFQLIEGRRLKYRK